MGKISSTLKVICQEDCGNAPRKEILKDFTIAIATRDSVHIKEWITDKTVWDTIGGKQIIGKEDLMETILSQWTENPVELHIKHIITHGKTAAIHGEFKFTDDSVLAFCDIYEFSSAGKKSKIKEIISYRV